MKPPKQNSQSFEKEVVGRLKALKSTPPSSRSRATSKSASTSALARSGSREANAILRRLDIDPKEVALIPKEPSEILTRCLGGGKKLPREKILSFAAVSPQPCAIAFMKAVRGIPALDLKRLSFEAMCVRARVSPVELLGAILMAAKSMKATESALKAILAHPDVVQATVDAASVGPPILVNGKPVKDENGKVLRLTHGDVAAQRIMHEAVGFLPTKKGGVEINFGFGRPPEERDEDDDADEAWDEAFPPLGDQIKTWSADKHKLLEGGK